MPELREFYDAFTPRFEEAIDYCDKFPLDDVPEDALNLLHLIYSMIMVSMAVEVFGTRNPPTPPTPSSTASARRCREDQGHTMSLLTINKLTASVGAEVTELDSDVLAGDDALGTAILDALEDNGVLVFPGLGLSPRRRWRSAAAWGDRPLVDGHHPVAGIYPVTLDKSKNASADYLRATFDWHIDGCTPTNGECPQKATVLSAKQVADRR